MHNENSKPERVQLEGLRLDRAHRPRPLGPLAACTPPDRATAHRVRRRRSTPSENRRQAATPPPIRRATTTTSRRPLRPPAIGSGPRRLDEVSRWEGRILGLLRRGVVVLAGTLVAASMLPAAGATAPSGTPGISPDTQFTPVTASVLTTPVPVNASDGKYHLAYELLLTNALPDEVAVDTVEVRDASSHHVVLSLAGADLAINMNPVGIPRDGEPAEPRIASSSTSIVWLDVTAPTRDGIPSRIDHRVVGTITAGGQPRPFEAVVLPLRISRDRPVVLGPPVAPGTWLASEGCCANLTHHRNGLAPINGVLGVPQRFAIDFFRLDNQNRTWIGDPTDLRSYLSYEQPTIAAADGTVVVAFDGLPDQLPPEPPPIPPIAETVGNHVIVKVSSGVYLLYAHMKPGTIEVQVGQRVRRGQQIGRIGSSGNSSTPHLHFQVLTTPTFFPTDSTPFVFDRFDVVGYETERIWDDNVGLQPNGTIPVAPAAQPTRRQRAMPLDRDVIVFSSTE
jgi:Peptidase family M23